MHMYFSTWALRRCAAPWLMRNPSAEERPLLHIAACLTPREEQTYCRLGFTKELF